MSGPPTSVDVLVIGGGPAGAATALRAAQLGHSVCLADRGSNLWHRGYAQSLAPSILPLLDTLGLRQDIEARCARSRGVLLLWGGDQPRYREFEGAGGFQIARPDLDRLVRAAAARAGATVLCPATVIDVQHTSQPDMPWIVRLAADGRMLDIRSRIIVDAAGRKSRIPGARMRKSPPLIGVLGQWHACRMGARSLVEAGGECWYWAGALRNGRATAAVFFDPRSRLLANGAPLPATYRRLIKDSRVLSEMLGGSPTHVIACDATSRHVRDPVATNLICVGEAAVSLDPLSSQGIQAAFTGALQAAIVLNTWLRQPTAAAAADAFYRDRHAEVIQRSHEHSCRLYAEAGRWFGTSFWHRRSFLQNNQKSTPAARPRTSVPSPLAPLQLAAGVRVRRIAVVRQDFAQFAPAIVPVGPERAVAFVGDVPVGELAKRLVAGKPAAEVVRTWSDLVGAGPALKALTWMWQSGVIEADSAAQTPRS